VENRSLVSLFDFENRLGLFPGIDSRMKFCLITMGSYIESSSTHAKFFFFAHKVEDLQDKERLFSLSPEDISLFNPNTRTCPIFRSLRDSKLARVIRQNHPVWRTINEKFSTSPWDVSIRRVIDINAQAELLKEGSNLSKAFERNKFGDFVSPEHKYLRLYEGKMICLFSHRLADAYTVAVGQRSGRSKDIEETELKDPFRVAQCRYWVSEEAVKESIPTWNRKWFFAYMDVCSTTNERTVIGAIIPHSAPTFSLRVLSSTSANPTQVASLCANMGSFCFDYYVRQFVGGLHLSDYIMFQMPVLPPETYQQQTPWISSEELLNWLRDRVLELTYSAWDLEPFARDVGYEGPPFRWDLERRFLLRCELDAAFFHLYGISQEDTDYILQTFPIVRKNDEKAYGEYRTKRVILEIYDEMAEAIRSGKPYQTRLDPPPADPRVAHPAQSRPDWAKKDES
jgi:hypothetical protein